MTDALLPWIAIVVSVGSFIATLFFSWQTSKFRKSQFKISREREIFDWATKTLEVIPDLKSGEQRKIENARARLSTQIDTGRLLFPNDHLTSVGSGKPEERRGLRSHILDPLIGIYNLSLPRDEPKLKGLQRKFTYDVGKNFTPVLTDTSPESLRTKRDKDRMANQ